MSALLDYLSRSFTATLDQYHIPEEQRKLWENGVIQTKIVHLKVHMLEPSQLGKSY